MTKTERRIAWTIAIAYYIIGGVIISFFIILTISDSITGAFIGVTFFATMMFLYHHNKTAHIVIKAWGKIAMKITNRIEKRLFINPDNNI